MFKNPLKYKFHIYIFFTSIFSMFLSLFAVINMHLIFQQIQIKFIFLPSFLGMVIGYLYAYNFILRKELQLSNQYKSDFLSKISHEIRTPLNAILGFTQILSLKKNREFTDADIDCIHHVKESSIHLLDLVNELLDLSRIESGKMKLYITDIHLNVFLEECISNIKYLADAKIVGIELNTLKESLSVSADRMRLKQVLINLLSNAVKYNIPQGKVFITARLSEENDQLEIAIEDTGTGIPDNCMEYIFEPFHRLEIHKDIDGAGVGLALSKKLMLAQGGDITCQSKLGKGSIFTVTADLPLKNRE